VRRRELIGVAGTALVAWPLVARAQQQAKIARLGYLGFGAPAASAARVEALRAGLRDLGYVEGKNLVIEFRWSSTVEQLHEAAAELVRMKVDSSSRPLQPSPSRPGRRPPRSPSSSRRMPTPWASAMYPVSRGQAET
jgi:putative tryptophan/tyrosine transport system substrate-binding protein